MAEVITVATSLSPGAKRLRIRPAVRTVSLAAGRYCSKWPVGGERDIADADGTGDAEV